MHRKQGHVCRWKWKAWWRHYSWSELLQMLPTHRPAQAKPVNYMQERSIITYLTQPTWHSRESPCRVMLASFSGTFTVTLNNVVWNKNYKDFCKLAYLYWVFLEDICYLLDHRRFGIILATWCRADIITYKILFSSLSSFTMQYCKNNCSEKT